MKTNREKSFLSKLCYGMADIYGGGAFVIIGTFFTVFLTKSLGMSAVAAGSIPLIGKVWDAITDPIMGNICDRTVSKFGPKRFFLLVGSIISAISFLLMWIVYPMQSMEGQYVFYMLMYMLFSTGFTIVMVPYNALLQDMVDDYKTRSAFSGIRIICSTFGAILAGLIPTIMIKDNTDAGSYFMVAVIFAVIFFVAIMVTFIGTWEKQKEPVKASLSQSFLQCTSVFKSRSFRLFIIIFLFGQGAADFVMGLAVYYIDDVLNAYGGGRFTYLMGVILLSQFVGTIVFSIVMPKTSKKLPLLLGFPVRIVASLAMLAFSHEGANFAIILFLTFFIGFGISGSSTTIYAIIVDLADVDELITSVNRPGTVSAMATFCRKVATGFSSAIIGLMLTLVGYDEVVASSGGRQSAATQAGIAYIYILVPVVFMLVAIIATKLFPITSKEFDVIKKEIARRRGEDQSVITPEEIAICERVTGYKYIELWDYEKSLSRSGKSYN